MKTGREDWDAMIRVSGIPADEPVFLLRAQNRSAADAVRAWAELELVAGTDPAVVEQALRQADAMDKWPVKKAIGADHLTEAERKQLAYAHARRRWNGGQITREAQAAALTMALMQAIEDAPSGDAFADRALDLKARVIALKHVLTGGRGAR